jgi:hypothetical protein
MVRQAGALALVLLLAACGSDSESNPLLPPESGAKKAASTTASPKPSAKPSVTPKRPTPRTVSTKPAPSKSATPAETPKPSASTKPKPAASPTAPPLPVLGQGRGFQLSDQFDKAHRIQFPMDRPCVLAFGDKDGSGQIEGWIKPLYEQYGDRIDIQGVAELGMVPGFARGMVKGIMSALTKNPVMLDWDGTVSKAYDYAGGGQAAIVVVDGDGAIRWRQTGAVTADGLAAAQDVLERLLVLP